MNFLEMKKLSKDYQNEFRGNFSLMETDKASLVQRYFGTL